MYRIAITGSGMELLVTGIATANYMAERWERMGYTVTIERIVR